MTETERIGKLKALKDEGHMLIEKVADAKCITISQVYDELQVKLGKALPESAHFSRMYTIRDAERAVAALKEMMPPKKKRGKKILPLAEQKAAIKKLGRKKIYLYIPKLYWKRITLISL